MRRSLWALAISATFAIGCGSSDQTSSGADTAVKGSFEGTKDSSPQPAGLDTPPKSGSVDPKELGVAIYPGATENLQLGGGTKTDMPEGVRITISFFSPDTVDKILAFYKKELKGAQAGGGALSGFVMGKNGAGDEVEVTIARDEEKKLTGIIIETKKKK